MKPNNQFILFNLFIALLVSVVWGVVLMPSSKATTKTAEPIKQEYTDIGNGIKRTDDLNKGVSCYMAPGGSLSCVKVNQ